MKKFTVIVPITVYANISVEAKDKEEAIEIALEDFVGLKNYCGNGGCDKLVGVTETNVSLETGEYTPPDNEIYVEEEE